MTIEAMKQTTMADLAARDGLVTNAAKAATWAEQVKQKSKELNRELLPEEAGGIGTQYESISPKMRRPLQPGDDSLIAAKNWKPVRYSDPVTATAYDDEIAKLQAEADAAADMAALGGAVGVKGQALAALKAAKRKELEARAQTAVIENHLESQRDTLAILNDLADWARWNSQVDQAGWLTILNATTQVQLVDGCPQERERLVQAAKAVRAAVVKEQQDQYAAKVAQLKGEREKLDRELRAMSKLAGPDPFDALYENYRDNPGDRQAELTYLRALEAKEGREPGYYCDPAAA